MENTVLLVEDDPDIREMLEEALRRILKVGVEAEASVQNLHEAIKQRRPTAVLIDTEVPDAVSLLRRIKSDPGTKDTPVVALYSRGTTSCAEAIREGFDECVDAGDINGLVERVKEYLGGSEP